MIQVTPLRDTTQEIFKKLFTDYYTELDCDDDPVHLADEYVLPDVIAGLVSVDILKDGEDFAGFVIYQKDDIDNEWNFKEGWGDVREIYISPAFRRKGLGKFLLFTAEMKLKEAGADRVYALPTEEAAPFFIACGYLKTDEYDDEFDCFVYEKTDLNNCKCG